MRKTLSRVLEYEKTISREENRFEFNAVPKSPNAIRGTLETLITFCLSNASLLVSSKWRLALRNSRGMLIPV